MDAAKAIRTPGNLSLPGHTRSYHFLPSSHASPSRNTSPTSAAVRFKSTACRGFFPTTVGIHATWQMQTVARPRHGRPDLLSSLSLSPSSSTRGGIAAAAAASSSASGGGLSVQQLVTMETNIDDSTPQILAYISELLLTAGALDVWMVNAIMKKGRPGVVLHVLCDRQQCDKMLSIILNESSSLGVRIVPCERVAVERLLESAMTPWGWVPVKAAYLQGKMITATAEYESCAAMARENHVPLKDVKFAAEKWFHENDVRERGL